MGHEKYLNQVLHVIICLSVVIVTSTPLLCDNILHNGGSKWYLWGTASCVPELVPLQGGQSINDTILRNNCPLASVQGHAALVCFVLFTLYIWVLGVLQDHKSAGVIPPAPPSTSTSSIVPTQNYSVMVSNPPADASSVQEWKEFFSQFGHVRWIVICRKNAPILQACIEHARIQATISTLESKASLRNVVLLPTMAVENTSGSTNTIEAPVTPSSNQNCLRRTVQYFGFCRDLTYWSRKLATLTDKISLACTSSSTGLKCDVSAIFVTFEAQYEQEKCLSRLNAGMLWTLWTDEEHREHKKLDEPERTRATGRFRGQHVLRVTEPPAPASVRWLDLDVKWTHQWWQRTVVSLVGLTILCSSLLLNSYLMAASIGPVAVAYGIAFVDVIMTWSLLHASDWDYYFSAEEAQASILWILVVFRCANATLVLYTLIPFEAVLTPRHMIHVHATVIAMLTLEPFLQIARRPPIKWNFEERYSSVARTVWIALFYLPLAPTVLIYSALGLLVQYWIDRYVLESSSAVAGGPSYYYDCATRHSKTLLAHEFRKILRCLCLASLLSAGCWYSGWPYDSACEADFYDPSKVSYVTCDKRPGELHRFFWPEINDTWMDAVQIDTLKLWHGLMPPIFSIAFLAKLIFWAIGRVYQCCSGRKTKKQNGSGKNGVAEEAPHANFSASTMPVYVPQIKLEFCKQPLALVPITQQNVSEEELDLQDILSRGRRPAISETLISENSTERLNQIFSQCKFYGPSTDTPRSESNASHHLVASV